MKMILNMRLENNQEHNTWFSREDQKEPYIQLHTEYEVWVAMGEPEIIRVEIEPFPSS